MNATEIGEVISQQLYGKSSKPEAPENQGDDFKKGFVAGCAATGEAGRDEVWRTTWDEYNNINSKEWQDWKRGWWAGRYRQIA
jgi:hypothetical protein